MMESEFETDFEIDTDESSMMYVIHVRLVHKSRISENALSRNELWNSPFCHLLRNGSDLCDIGWRHGDNGCL